MTFVAKPKAHHPNLPLNELGLTRRDYEGSVTGGRVWNTFLGSPVAILTTVGRKTGKTRKIPLLYLKQGDNVVMTASKGGMTKLPIWYHNVKAAPSVHIQVGTEKKEYTMREATPEEERELWPKLEAMYNDYKEYRARTEGIRSIPVLIFTPVAG